VYAQQSYLPLIAAPSKLANSTGNRSNATTTANTPIDKQHQTTSLSSSLPMPSIESQQSSPSNPSTTDDDGFSTGLRDGKTQGFIDAKAVSLVLEHGKFAYNEGCYTKELAT
jgi:hypothetical protein